MKQTLEQWAPRVLSILRNFTAVLFFEHGLQKLFNLPPAPDGMALPAMSRCPGLRAFLSLSVERF